MATMIVKNCKHGDLTILETVYDFNKGDIVYPVSTRDKYPDFNENRHKVVFYSEFATVEEVTVMVEKAKARKAKISG